MPMTSNKASQLVDLIDSQAAAASNTMEVLLYQRDALIALLMWEAAFVALTAASSGFKTPSTPVVAQPSYPYQSRYQLVAS